MKDQINTIREALKIEGFICTHGSDAPVHITEALAALDQLEAMVVAQEPVAYYYQKHNCFGQLVWNVGFVAPGDATYCYPLYTAAPVAQQPQKLEDVEQYRMQMAGICAAAMGYWKEGDSIHPDYDTPALRDVAKLYAKYDALYKAQQPQAERKERLEAALLTVFGWKQPQAEAVPLTHVLVPVDEPTDEMVDAACAAVDGLCRVDFVRAYVAAFAHLKAGYRDESYWCGWNAAIKFQQAESAHQYNLANRLRVHLANRHTLTGPEFKDGVAGILAEYYTAPQQAEAVPSDVVRNADVEAAAKKMAEIFDYPWDFMPEEGRNTMRENVRAVLDAAIAQQKGGV